MEAKFFAVIAYRVEQPVVTVLIRRAKLNRIVPAGAKM
jgi:hypothetical protein